MKIASIIGTRPNFVKAVPVSKEIRVVHEEVLIHTGQHYDYEMNKIFFEELVLPKPDYHLEVGSGTHAHQTGEMMMGVEKVLMRERPDLVLVYGDCNTTLAGALAAAKLHFPIAHVEAGPRFFDKTVVEEINRVLTDHISSLLFAPTQKSVNNLLKEGLNEGVYFTGDVMFDNFLNFSKIVDKKSKIIRELGLGKKDYFVLTIHKEENTNIETNLKNIIEAMLEIDERIVFPIHPRTEKYSRRYDLYKKLEDARNILLIDPVGHLDFLKLIKNAKKVLTDSGGVQKEAYFSKVPCVTIRGVTGWPETVEDGWNILVKSRKKEEIIHTAESFEPEKEQTAIFGNGTASKKICDRIGEFT